MTTDQLKNRPLPLQEPFTRSAQLRTHSVHLQHKVTRLCDASQGLRERSKSQRAAFESAKACTAPGRTTPPALRADPAGALPARQFQGLTEVPPALDWCATIPNIQTRRAYQSDLTDFCRSIGLEHPEGLPTVTRAHVLAWRAHLERQGLAASSIQRKLAALSSFFAYLCTRHTVASNPVHGVQRPQRATREGGTPALSDAQATALLAAPP
jgi:hypothetical protein